MNPQDTSPPPDYSFITDQPSTSPTPSGIHKNNKKLLLLIVAVAVMIIIVLFVSLTNLTRQQKSQANASRYVENGFIVPISQGDYAAAAEFISKNNEKTVIATEESIKRTFTSSLDPKTCVINDEYREEDSQRVHVIVKCSNDAGQIDFDFRLFESANGISFTELGFTDERS